MTTVSLGPAPPRPVPLGAAASRPQSRGVLVEVEFRKMLDTRAGLALAVATLVASVVVVCFDLAGLGRRPVAVRALIQDAAMPPTVFLPVLAVLARRHRRVGAGGPRWSPSRSRRGATGCSRPRRGRRWCSGRW